VAYHIHPIRDVVTYREASACVGRDGNRAYVCTLYGAEDEELIQTYKNSSKSVNGSSMVINGESVTSTTAPNVTQEDIYRAFDDSDDEN
jgi:superfamily II DNA helicase RecQ